MKKFFTLLFVSILFAGNTFAGGFQTGTQNARAMGMGHAFVGMAADASAIYFNPAGLANLRGFNLVAGTTLIMPTVDFTGPKPLTTKTSTEKKTFTPINFYAAYAMDNGFSFGVGVYNPYGLGSEWSSSWIGKALAVKTELKTFYINPTVSYKFSNDFSLGLGFIYIISDVSMSRRITSVPGVPVPTNIMSDLTGDGSAISFSAGLLYKPIQVLSIGVSYRHSAEVEYDGEVSFSNLTVGIPAVDAALAAGFKTSKGKAIINMPSDLRVGLSYNATEDFTINADVMFVGWSIYKELGAKFDNAAYNMSAPKNWENTIGFKLGGEYRMNALALRAGYVYDGSPIPTKYMDPSLPGSNRHEFTVGVGYQISSNFRFDVAYQFISFTEEVDDSSIPFNGTYENSTNLFGLNFAYSL